MKKCVCAIFLLKTKTKFKVFHLNPGNTDLFGQEGDTNLAGLCGHKSDLARPGQRAGRRLRAVQWDAEAQELRHDCRVTALLEQPAL